jgi:hypothetical protein
MTPTSQVSEAAWRQVLHVAYCTAFGPGGRIDYDRNGRVICPKTGEYCVYKIFRDDGTWDVCQRWTKEKIEANILHMF